MATLGIVGAVVIGGTTAIFSDTEVSTGNTFTAGAIDLTVDNDSYYNGEFNQGTSWIQANLDDGQGPGENGAYWFFDFRDLKPGDWGEDTISLHVKNNDAYLCADVTLTNNQDNGSTEPELNDETPYTSGRGELGDRVNFIAWADDGDNVLESDEYAFDVGTLGGLGIGETATAALADSNTNAWNPNYAGGPLAGDTTKYIGKAWCFGDLDLAASTYPQDGKGAEDGNSGPDERPIVCDGSGEDNSTQTDTLTADISFRAVQARHNEDFVCEPETKPTTATLTVDKIVAFTGITVDVDVSNFDLFIDDGSGPVPVTDEVSVAGLAPGTYTVTETQNGGAGVISSTTFGLDCATNGVLILNAGDNKTCQITNFVDPS